MRVPQSAQRQMLVRRRHCTLYGATVTLQTHMRARTLRNLYLTAKIWCKRQSARGGGGGGEADGGGGGKMAHLMWQLLGKRSGNEYVKVQTGSQHGLWMAGIYIYI